MRAAVTVLIPIPSPRKRIAFFARLGVEFGRCELSTAVGGSTLSRFVPAHANRSWSAAAIAIAVAKIAMLRGSTITRSIPPGVFATANAGPF
jgi:hypothetical protein